MIRKNDALPLLLAAFSLAAGLQLQASAETTSRPASPRPGATSEARDTVAIAEAAAALDDKLLDYPGARFRNVRLVQTNTGFRAFCGDLNITNRMGGYTGWRAFLLPLGETGVAGLYDKPTIEGQPTQVGSFFNRYGSRKIEGDPATRLIAGACGAEAKRLDEFDYAFALTYKAQVD